MKVIKKILANPLIKKLVSKKWIKYIMVALIMVAALLALIKLLKSLKEKKEEKAADGGEEEQKLAPMSLVKIWKEFRKQIPREFRRIILLYQPAVVLGEAGSGKTLLVDNFTDWKGQSYQFYPSYTADPDFQIYLGSEALVQEIPASLLNDTSQEARTALTKVWKSFFRKRNPTIIVTLKADALSATSPDTLKKQAQMLRGKINLIYRLRKESVPVRIVLTHMDQVAGYLAFNQFLYDNEIPLQIDLKEYMGVYQRIESDNDLQHCLEPYEKYLSHALTTMPAQDYKDLMKFMTEAPDTLTSTAIFLQALTAPDAFDHRLDVENLYLISNISEKQVANPFRSSWADEVEKIIRKGLWRHRIACILVAALFSVVFLTEYFTENMTWKGATNSVARLQEMPKNSVFENASNQIVTANMKPKLLSGRIFYGSFAKEYRDSMNKDFAQAVTKYYEQEWQKNNDEIAKLREETGEVTSQEVAQRMNKLAGLLIQIKNLKKIISDIEIHEKELNQQFIRGAKTLYKNEWKEAYDLIDRFKKKPQNEILFTKTQNKVADLNDLLVKIESMKKNVPEIIEHFENDFSGPYLKGTRTFLIVLEKRSRKTKKPHETTLYLLSLIYASRNNYMGKLISKNPVQWAKNLEIPKRVVIKYVRESKEQWEGRLVIEKIHYDEDVSPSNSHEPWLRYFLELERVFRRRVPLSPELLRSLQKYTYELEYAIEEVKSYEFSQILFDYLDRETQFDVRSIYAPLKVTGWIGENADTLQDFFRLIRRYDLNHVKDPKQNAALQQLLDNLKGVKTLTIEDQKKFEGEAEKSFEFKMTRRRFKFRVKDWQRLIQNRKMSLLIDNFIVQNERRDEQMFISGRVKLPEQIHYRPSDDGTIFFVWNGKIDGRYIRESYEKEVKPVLLDFAENIDISAKDRDNKDLLANYIDKEQRRILSNFVAKKANKYADDYRKYYEKYYLSFGVKSDSIIEYNVVMAQMLQVQGSPFQDFLKNISEHTDLEQVPCIYLRPLYRKLQPFQAINALVGDKKKTMEEYQNILQQIQDGLAAGGGAGEEEAAEEEEAAPEGEASEQPTEQMSLMEFSKTLTAAGSLSMPIFLRKRDSHLAAARKLLKDAGIGGKWQKPFLSPILKLYRLGLNDIEESAQINWDKYVLPEIYPIVTKFPFNANSQKAVTPLELEQALHPREGKFWKAYFKTISPICIRRAGVWQARKPYKGKIKLPYNMLAMVNHLQWLSGKLWDADGNAQALVLQIKPVPLSFHTYGDERRFATMAYLKAGNQAVFNFNQQPSWQEFKWEWWKQETAKTGVEFSIPDNVQKTERTIVVNDEIWNFYRLMRRGKSVEKKTLWQWNLPEEASDYTAFLAKYYVQLHGEEKNDPWRLFQTPVVYFPEELLETSEPESEKPEQEQEEK